MTRSKRKFVPTDTHSNRSCRLKVQNAQDNVVGSAIPFTKSKLNGIKIKTREIIPITLQYPSVQL